MGHPSFLFLRKFYLLKVVSGNHMTVVFLTPFTNCLSGVFRKVVSNGSHEPNIYM